MNNTMNSGEYLFSWRSIWRLPAVSQPPSALSSVPVLILGTNKQEHRKVQPKVTQLGVVEWALNPHSPALASFHHTLPPLFPPSCPQHLLRARPDASWAMSIQPSQQPRRGLLGGILPVIELGNPRTKEVG
uniref:Uncharacterized protein n=1 Tax=Molossus molossus TaxID=27622 RepID=A0A7J8CZA0_MOLMO|nr:hypothetical protein HJG59_009493 [Molossus molossus]